MARTARTYAPANGRTFLIVEETGKAPFKAILRNAEGIETERTHHKTRDLALAKCATLNPNIPVVE